MPIVEWTPGVALAFLLTVFVIHALKNPARQWGWVDKPNHRKHHEGAIPLVGGTAMFIALVIAWFTVDRSLAPPGGLLGGMCILVVTGIYDDRHESPASLRFAAQIIAASCIIWGDGVYLSSLGDLLGPDEITLGLTAVPFTIFCVVGVINALNMIDGLDGLAGGLALSTTLWLLLLAPASGLHEPAALLLGLLAAVIAGFLYFNLRHPWRRQASVFMGDAGSMVLGLVLAWCCVKLSQGEQRAFSPIVAVWIFGLPLMDTITIMIRRMLRGQSPFQSDRRHIHHLLLGAGYPAARTTAYLLLFAAVLGGMGVAVWYAEVPEHWMFYGFLSLFALYFFMTTMAWRVMDKAGPVAVAPETNESRQ
jgi:UDP-GlcNAc:undecaprenyl-phosphate GlcNAc-1-phosphate transferase